jgi:hypothetical protein
MIEIDIEKGYCIEVDSKNQLEILKNNYQKAIDVINQNRKLITEIQEKGKQPFVLIQKKGFLGSWYNKHIGKKYKLLKLIDGNSIVYPYENFIVKSDLDGTKKGNGKDIVFSFSAIIIEE